MEKASPLTWERCLQVLRDARGNKRTVKQVTTAIFGRGGNQRLRVKTGDLLVMMADAGVILRNRIQAPIEDHPFWLPQEALHRPCPECGGAVACLRSSSGLHGDDWMCYRCGFQWRA